MRVSVVVRSRDEADRLRLTLTSLARQTAAAEFVVVDDGSADHTAAVIAGAEMSVVCVRHAIPQGRSAAANAGARAASGDLLVFLDGDTLASPDMVACHAAAAGGRRIGRGETWHLRCTRHLRDPETGSLQPGRAVAPAGIAAMKITRQQIRHDFASIARRAQPGIYPGLGPRRLHELEMAALREHPDCEVLWAAASGSNLAVPREAFLAAGGFDEALDINEHRELALRLCTRQPGTRQLGTRQLGTRQLAMVPVEGARTYHMTHRIGWRDPLREKEWEEIFFRAHPIPAVRLLRRFWASIADAGQSGIDSLPELAAAARQASAIA